MELGNVRKEAAKTKRFKEFRERSPDEYKEYVEKLGRDPIEVAEFFRRVSGKFQEELGERGSRFQHRVERLQARLKQLEEKKPLPTFERKEKK